MKTTDHHLFLLNLCMLLLIMPGASLRLRAQEPNANALPIIERLRQIEARAVTPNHVRQTDHPTDWFWAAKKIDPESEDGLFLEYLPRDIELTKDLAYQLISMVDIVYASRGATAEPQTLEFCSASGDILEDMGSKALPFVQDALASAGISEAHRKVLVYVEKRIKGAEESRARTDARRASKGQTKPLRDALPQPHVPMPPGQADTNPPSSNGEDTIRIAQSLKANPSAPLLVWAILIAAAIGLIFLALKNRKTQ